jgi:hypothetical protein
MQLLNKKQRQALEFNWLSTSELIDNVDELISRLHTGSCISTRQLHALGKQPPSLQPKNLLEVLTRKSITVFDAFVSCLPDIARHHVLRLLKNASGNVNYHLYDKLCLVLFFLLCELIVQSSE